MASVLSEYIHFPKPGDSGTARFGDKERGDHSGNAQRSDSPALPGNDPHSSEPTVYGQRSGG